MTVYTTGSGIDRLIKAGQSRTAKQQGLRPKSCQSQAFMEQPCLRHRKGLRCSQKRTLATLCNAFQMDDMINIRKLESELCESADLLCASSKLT